MRRPDLVAEYRLGAGPGFSDHTGGSSMTVHNRGSLAVVFSLFLGLGALASLQPTASIAAPSLESASSPVLPAAPRIGRCGAVISSTLNTRRTTVCSSATVSVTVSPYCPVCPGGMHVIFVHTDTPQARWQESESRKVLDDMQRWADRFMEEGADFQAAVIEYDNNGAQTKAKLTDNMNTVHGQLMADTTYNPRGKAVDAAKLALREMDQARRASKDSPCEVVIMYAYTKSHYQDQRQILLDAAKMLKAKAKLMVGCPMDPGAWYCRGPEPEMPMSQRFFTKFNESGRLRRMVQDEMANFPKGADVRAMVLEQVLPTGLDYELDSATGGDPTVESDSDGRTVLRWSWSDPRTLQAYSVTYRVRSQGPAIYPIRGELTVTDSGRLAQTLAAPEQLLAVEPAICFTPTPVPPTDTSTPPPPTDTATSTSTSTATATATSSATATATPTQGRYTIYLPFLHWEKQICVPESVFTDVVLVLDMSTSMYRPTRENGRSKHLAALEAARAFLSLLTWDDGAQHHDQVAVVAFNDTAWTEMGLGSDHGKALAALERLPARIAQGTRLDLALDQARETLLSGPRLGSNRPTVILLTDGLPNRVPFGPGSDSPECPNQECTVLRAAARMKADGSRLFTIGLGEDDDVLRELLRESASTPGDFFFAPDGDDLAGIYRQIAGRITECP